MNDVASPPVPTARLAGLTPFWAGIATAAPGLVVLALVRPQSPDLIAQLARSAAAQATSGATWWTSWYGGLTTPSYSFITPRLMGWVGVWTAGIASVFVLAFGTSRLVHGTHHARLAMVAVSLGGVANLASGRITFAIGSALAALALWQLRSKKVPFAAALSALSTLASPLAGLFLVLVATSLLPQTHWRKLAIAVIAPAGAVIAATWLAFPLPGTMPMGWEDICFGLVTCAALWSIRLPRTARLIVATTALAILAFFIVPSPVGSNISRLPMLFGAPLVIAMSSRRKLAISIASALLLWAGVSAASDLSDGANRSSHASFYAPLLAHLPAMGSAVNRVEVVDPVNHGPALYVARVLPLARGWERQIDVARNPLFYKPGLSPQIYRQWLDNFSVRWVALPTGTLDYASVAEGALVQSNLPYLRITWQNADWKLYEVENPAPLTNAPFSISDMTADTVTFHASSPGSSQVQIAWTPGLSFENVDNLASNGTVTRSGQWIRVQVSTSGTYVLRHQT